MSGGPHSPHSPSTYRDNKLALEREFRETYEAAVRALPPPDETHVLRDPPSVSPALGGTGGRTTSLRLFNLATKPAPPRQGADLTAPLMQMSPTEREVGRTSRSGRQLSELEILQEKHELEFRRVVPVVAQSLREVVAQHENLLRSGAQRDDKYATYETNAVPTIKIDDYVQRIAEYTYISPSTLIGTLIVLDRLSQRHPTLLFTMLNIYKIFFVAVRIASKVVDLRTLNNKNFASVGGISNRHLNEVEARMLSDLRFDLYIHPNEIVLYTQRAFAGFPGFVPRGPAMQHIMHLYHISLFEGAGSPTAGAPAAFAAVASSPAASPTGLLTAGSPAGAGGQLQYSSQRRGSSSGPGVRGNVSPNNNDAGSSSSLPAPAGSKALGVAANSYGVIPNSSSTSSSSASPPALPRPPALASAGVGAAGAGAAGSDPSSRLAVRRPSSTLYTSG